MAKKPKESNKYPHEDKVWDLDRKVGVWRNGFYHCLKCGAWDAQEHWTTASIRNRYSVCGGLLWLDAAMGVAVRLDEAIIRTCRDCGFWWTTATRDYKEPEPVVYVMLPIVETSSQSTNALPNSSEQKQLSESSLVDEPSEELKQVMEITREMDAIAPEVPMSEVPLLINKPKVKKKISLAGLLLYPILVVIKKVPSHI